MKRVALILVILLAAGSLFAAPFKLGGATDATFLQGLSNSGNRYSVGQDVNVTWGILSAAFTLDYIGIPNVTAHDIAFTYNVGLDPKWGPLKAGFHITGDQEFVSAGGTLQEFKPSGDYLSDFLITTGLGFGQVGIDFAFDGSVEKGYQFVQAVDTSVYWAPKHFELRAGILYMDPQAVTDDVGHPNAPASHAGTSFYAKAKVSY